jgi:hypothetical protein
MNSAIDINNFNINYIYFYKVVPNSIIEEGFFNSLFYSTDKYSTTGINIYCLFEDSKIAKYYHKYKVWFDINTNNNAKIIKELENIEQMIISKLNISSKIPIFKLSQHIRSGNVKLFKYGNPLNGICLKISGIWQSKHNYGITFKFQIVQQIITHRLKNILN